MINKRKLILILIFATSMFIRLYKITSSPPSLSNDEVDSSYQAFVFNHYQSDYFGNKLPSLFHSFVDYQSPGTIYLISLSQKIFGYKDFSARFPSAILGSLTIFPIFYLILLLTKNIKTAFFASFILAINPWHIHFSRLAFGVSGMLFFYTTGLVYTLKFLKKQKPRIALAACLSMLTSMHFYPTAKLFVFITGLMFIIFYYSKIVTIKIKPYLSVIAICLLLLIPFIKDMANGNASYRLSYNNVWSDPFISDEIKQSRHRYSLVKNGVQLNLIPDIYNKLTNNRYTIITQKIAKNYLQFFSTNFLFLTGDGNLRQGFKKHGYFYLIDFLLIIYGLTKIHNKKQKFILLLFLLSPIPFSLTNDSITAHATRLFLMIPFYIVLISQTILILKKWSRTLLIFIYLGSFFYFYNFYLYQYPSFSAKEWHYNHKQTVQNLPKDNNTKVIFSNEKESFLPFFLFYSQYLPTNGNLDNNLTNSDLSFVDGQTLDNHYYFGHINWNNISPDKTIYVISQEELKNIPSSINFNIIYQSPPSPYDEKINYSIIKI